MKSEVSVIMYVKNGMPYFKRALQSVIGQTLCNLEILVVDGGSLDGTIEYVKYCQSLDSRIRLLHSAKGSVGAQFNIGLEEARGEYIGIVESDDYILPEMYEEELSCARACGCDVLRADNFIFFGTGAGEVRLQTKVSHKKSNYGRSINASQEPENVLIGGSYWTGLYRREFLLEKKIRMNETPGAAYQDFGFLFLAGALAKNVYMMPKAFYCYRKDNPSSSCNNPDRLEMPIQEYRFLEKELKQRRIWEQYKAYFFLWKIRNERWFYFNLDEAAKKCYVHMIYEDLKEISGRACLFMRFPNKEEIFLDAVDKGEENLYEYLKGKEQTWIESTGKIERAGQAESQNAGSVYLFGAGNIGRIMCYFLQNRKGKANQQGKMPLAYVDNAAGLWGTEMDGTPVISPREALQERGGFFIVCSENYAEEIYSQLREAGVDDCHIAICDDMDSCIRLVMKRY